MSATPVQLFVLDPAFTNQAIPTPPFFHSAGGIASLSSRGLGYFVQPYLIQDSRVASTRNVAWAPETTSACLVDNTEYAAFLAAMAVASSAVSAALFGIIDILAFNYNHTTSVKTLEALLVGNTNLAPYYAPTTLTVAGATNIGTVYQKNLSTVAVTCPIQVNFVLLVPSGSSSLSYAITAWIDNASFLEAYANSTITAVVPPTDYTDLLTASFATTSGTMATDAANGAFAQPLINTAIRNTEPSGYAAYVAKVYDGAAVLNMTFGIVYTGQVPSFAAMREAILAAVTASGVGNAAQWQVRIPELFVQSRIYLIPLWDQTITSGSGTLYAGISSPATMLSKAATALGGTAANTWVTQYGQILMAAYDLLPLVATPDSITQPSDSLASLYPTYQAYAPNNANFLYMSADAQAFATTLNTVLPIAAGLATNTAYPTIIDGSLSYISFTQNLTEFCVLTKSYYNRIVGF